MAFGRSRWNLVDAMEEHSFGFVVVEEVGLVFGSTLSAVVAGRVEGVPD